MSSWQGLKSSCSPAVRLWSSVFGSFNRHQGGLRAAALTYTTILSLVPFLAIAFSLLKGLGAQNSLEPLLLSLLGDSSEDLAARIIGYVNNTNVKSLGMIGLIMLVVTVITLLGSIEEAFNITWGVTETRSLRRRFSDYLSVVVVGPLLIFAAMSMTSAMQSQSAVQWLISHTSLGGAIHFLFGLLPYLSIWGALTFLYIYIPNTKVQVRSAILGAVIAGTLWQIAHWGYFHFQIGVAGYNAIYGTLASLPVFLVWIYTSWIIVLLGLEFVKAHQLHSESVNLPVRPDKGPTPAMRRIVLPLERKRQLRRSRAYPFLLICLVFLAICMPGSVYAAPSSIKVVMDDNYPPYIFRNSDGKLQGILVDQWSLWEKKTGIRAEIQAMDWATAQKRMEAGDFDVIDTIFKTRPREEKYIFSAPYATLDVPIFFDREITGIKDVSSVKGFRVAAKEGDAAVEFLRANGVEKIILYPSYESIIEAAAKDTGVAVFVIDRPPAMHFLHKSGIHNRFRQTEPLYSGQFHRAVKKEHPETLGLVEDGFSRISEKEYQKIAETWTGITASSFAIGSWIFYGLGIVLLILALLLLWNRTLKRMVERKTEDLRESEEKYRQLVQKAGSVILRWDKNGVVTFINDYGLDFFGYSTEEIVGRHVCDTILPENDVDGRNLREMISQIVISPDQYQNNVNENIRKNGERVWIAWNNQPIFDESGVVLEILSVGTDVTERKGTEEALRRSDELFRAFMHHFPGLSFLKDSGLKVVFANDGFDRYLGLPSAEMIGKHNRELFPGEFGEKITAEDLALLESGEPVRIEENYDGRTWMTYKFILPRRGGSPLIGGFNLDITDLKDVQKELISARGEAEAASEAKSLFLANMSHEIRTPLNAIIGINSIMQERLEPGELRDLVGDSSIAARNLLEVISDVLDISKIEAGKLKVVLIPFDVRLIVTQLERMFAMLAKEKGIELDVSMASGLPAWLKGDPARIQQIGVNLLSNAIKFTDQGKVSLQVSGRPDGEDSFLLELTVKDSGKGISPENLEMIFSPFIQEDLTTTRKYGGTGLGLAISLHLAKIMGGGIEVKSTPGSGSSFVCTIRCSIAAPVKQRPPQRVTTDFPMRQLKILVAEDSMVNRKMMEAILRMERHKAKFVENGIDAVKAWQEGKFDLILMDIQMPEMDGMQATMEIRKLESDSGSHIPIIALTAYAMAGDKERFIASGMDGYLAKPITVDQLRETLIAHGGDNA